MSTFWGLGAYGSLSLTKKSIDENRGSLHGLEEDVRQAPERLVLTGVDPGVTSQRHVQELGRLADDLRVTQVNRVVEDVQEPEPRLRDAVVVHRRGKDRRVLFS